MLEEGGLLESLEEDMEKLKEQTTGEPNEERENYEPDSKASRDRIESRRAKRTPQNEDAAPQNDGGDARGSSGDSQGSSEGTHEDAQPVQEDVEEAPKDAAGWAKHRREKRELAAENKRLADLVAKGTQPKADPEVKLDTKSETNTANPEPDKEKDLAGWLVWNAEEQKKWREEQTIKSSKDQETQKVNNLVSAAREEIDQIQDAYRKTNPDYDNAINHAKAEYTRALKLLNPSLTDAQAKAAIDKETFQIALHCNKNGMNLGEVLYDAAIERFGYVKSEESGETKPATPNLKLINNNKKKSASPLEGGGQKAAGRITLEAAANMSPAELQSLGAEDWKYLESHGF